MVSPGGHLRCRGFRATVASRKQLSSMWLLEVTDFASITPPIIFNLVESPFALWFLGWLCGCCGAPSPTPPPPSWHLRGAFHSDFGTPSAWGLAKLNVGRCCGNVQVSWKSMFRFKIPGRPQGCRRIPKTEFLFKKGFFTWEVGALP